MEKPKITSDALTRTRRNLPHFQVGGAWYFLTFRTASRQLSPKEREEVMVCTKYDHQRKYELAVAVVMPDHVHLLLSPVKKRNGGYYSLSEIMKPLKGVSARRINAFNGGNGSVWQDEWLDRIVRDEHEFIEKRDYIVSNAVTAGLAQKPEEYRWLIVMKPYGDGK